jgi:hypothetical protein
VRPAPAAGALLGSGRRLALLAFVVALLTVGLGSSASGRDTGGAPQRTREPDNSAPQASGPVGTSGIILHDGTGHDPDFFYFKVLPGREVQIAVKNLNGRCGANPDADFVKTATAPEGELHNFESVGASAGSIKTYPASGFDHVKLIVGVLSPNIGNNGASNKGCSELVRVSPASALILTRAPGDRRKLRAPILADQ